MCSVLQDLALNQLLQKQLLPYLRAGAAAVLLAVDRASRVMAELTSVKGLIQGTPGLTSCLTRNQHVCCIGKQLYSALNVNLLVILWSITMYTKPG